MYQTWLNWDQTINKNWEVCCYCLGMKRTLSSSKKCDLHWQAMSAEANLERYEDEGGQDAKWVKVLDVSNNAFYFPTE